MKSCPQANWTFSNRWIQKFPVVVSGKRQVRYRKWTLVFEYTPETQMSENGDSQWILS